MRNIVIIILFFMIIVGCGTDSMYYWGGYGSSIHQYKRAPTGERYKKHKQTLADIIEKSEEMNKRVPPGVYADYGYALAREGKIEAASRYFDLEVTTYPESRDFMEKVKESFLQ